MYSHCAGNGKTLITEVHLLFISLHGVFLGPFKENFGSHGITEVLFLDCMEPGVQILLDVLLGAGRRSLLP